MRKCKILTLSIILALTPIIQAQIVIIAHKSVPVNDISDAQTLDFYTGDIREWKNGKPIIVFDLKEKGDVKETFYTFLGKTTSRMKSIWMKRMLSGEGDPPEALATEEEMLTRVSATPGAIGFLNKNIVNDKVKVLAVIKNSHKSE